MKSSNEFMLKHGKNRTSHSVTNQAMTYLVDFQIHETQFLDTLQTSARYTKCINTHAKSVALNIEYS